MPSQHGHLLSAFQRLFQFTGHKFQFRQAPLTRIRGDGIHYRLAALLLQEAVRAAQEIRRAYRTFLQFGDEFIGTHREESKGKDENAKGQK